MSEQQSTGITKVQQPESYQSMPDNKGHFGIYGGMFVSETLMVPLQELNEALTNQQQQLTHMQVLVEKLHERLVELVDKMQPDASIEPPPPHY